MATNPGLYADRIPARNQTLAEMIERACDTAAARDAANDADWNRLDDRASEAEQAMHRAIERAGLTDALRRAAHAGMLYLSSNAGEGEV